MELAGVDELEHRGRGEHLVHRADPEPEGFERWCGARRWMHAAAISVELLAKLVRKASRIKVSEMLPTPDQAWLTDAEGRRYSCELRASALDLRPSSVRR